MPKEPKVYTFVGTERERVDPRRYEQALRSWTAYLVRHVVEERLRRQNERRTDW